jgi:hypothetical protein
MLIVAPWFILFFMTEWAFGWASLWTWLAIGLMIGHVLLDGRFVARTETVAAPHITG